MPLSPPSGPVPAPGGRPSARLHPPREEGHSPDDLVRASSTHVNVPHPSSGVDWRSINADGGHPVRAPRVHAEPTAGTDHGRPMGPVDFGRSLIDDWSTTFARFESYSCDAWRRGPEGSDIRHPDVHAVLAADGTRDDRGLAYLYAAHAAAVSGQAPGTLLKLARKAVVRFPVERDPLAHAAALRLLALARRGEGSPTSRAKAIEFLKKASDIKIELGFAGECVPEFIVLSDLCRTEGRHREIVAHMRRAVHCAGESVRPADVIDAQLLAADVYVLFRQDKKARRSLAAAGESLDRVAPGYEAGSFERLRSDVGSMRPPLGPTCPCICRSGLHYEACCGTADGRPVEMVLFQRIKGKRRHLVHPNALAAGRVGRALDVLVRETDAPEEGRTFTILRDEGGPRLSHLPDIATRTLHGARMLANLAADRRQPDGCPQDTVVPLAVVLTSVCALEAFINAVAYLIALDGPTAWPGLIVPGLFWKDNETYQSGGKLLVKWQQVGEGLFGEKWIRDGRLNDLAFLLGVRNELVHFKSCSVEPVALVKSVEIKELRNLPKGVRLRPPPGTWVDRLLDHGFADWTVSLAEDLTGSFRTAYAARRTP